MVQGVDDQHQPATGGRHVQRVGKRRAEGIGIVGDLQLAAEPPLQFAQNPPKHGRPIGAVGRGTDEVQQHLIPGMRLPIPFGPVGQQGRLAHSRFTQHNQRRTVSRDVRVDAVEILLPTDVTANLPLANLPNRAAAGERLVLGRLPLERRWLRTGRKFLIDDPRQIRQNHLSHRFGVGIVFAHRQLAITNQLFERVQLLPVVRYPFNVGSHCRTGVAEIEAGPIRHVRVVQYAMQNFQFRDTLLFVLDFGQPGLLLKQFRREALGHPAVAISQQADEEGAAAIDLGQTDRQHLPLGALLLSDAPPQINVGKNHAPLVAQLTQLWKDPQHQLIPLGLHVAKRGRDEDPNNTRRSNFRLRILLALGRLLSRARQYYQRSI